MSLFNTLADYKFAVINTSYRNATLLDITLFKSFDDGRKFMRESARDAIEHMFYLFTEVPFDAFLMRCDKALSK